MNRFKKFWIIFASFLPFAAGAASPLIIGGIAGLGFIAGFSIYRSFTPVDMSGALSFFSSCWSCEMFSSIMLAMSDLLPVAYLAIGKVMIPIVISLTAIWFAWRIISGFLGLGKIETENTWTMVGEFSTHIIKLGFVVALLALPLPRMLTSIVIEPIFNVGLSLNRVVSGDETFNTCVLATALADPVSVDKKASDKGAYSPKLRHNLSCELATVHQMTGLGMTAGWTMLNMSFDSDYMHKLMWNIPFFPNVPIFFTGLAIIVLFLFALLPIPVYFLEVFIKLSMNLIMLPLMLLQWLFGEWKIIKGGGQNLKGVINEVIQGTAGIAVLGVFLSFAIMFLSAMFGGYKGASVLSVALKNNDATILMDGLMMKNDSLITIVLMGLFISMFMISIPTLIKTLFSNFEIKDKFYATTEKTVKTMWTNLKKWYEGIRK